MASQPSLTQPQQSIYDLMSQTLASWGLTTLLPDVKRLITGGDTSPDTLSLALSQTDAYKKRFSGNELRKAAGLPELNPAQYIAMEEGYKNILTAYGLPDVYGQHDYMAEMIGKDLSASEVQSRAQIAHDQYTSAPQYVQDLWQRYYGTKGDAIAGILDPNVGTQLIQDRSVQVGIGGAAAQFGMGVNQSRAQQLQQGGVTLANAQKAYQQIAASRTADTSIASRFGTQFTQADEENDLLLGDAQAGAKRQSLYNEEEGLFKGHTGLDSSALGVDQNF